jgi:hypothetical protein
MVKIGSQDGVDHPIEEGGAIEVSELTQQHATDAMSEKNVHQPKYGELSGESNPNEIGYSNPRSQIEIKRNQLKQQEKIVGSGKKISGEELLCDGE